MVSKTQNGSTGNALTGFRGEIPAEASRLTSKKSAPSLIDSIVPGGFALVPVGIAGFQTSSVEAITHAGFSFSFSY